MEHRAHFAAAAPDFRAVFDAAPVCCLVLDRDLTIVAVNRAYLRATMTEREGLIGRKMLDAFPDNPEDPAATGVARLRASFERVLATGRPDAMVIQKYDIRRPGREDEFEERWWAPINAPVLDESGQVLWIIHSVEDVTQWITRPKRRRPAKEDAPSSEQLRRNEQERAELREGLQMYRLLAARLQSEKEEFRASMARELHDELGQALTGIKIDLTNLRQRLQRSETDSALALLAEISASAEELLRSVRRVAADLRPPLLDQVGLAAAVRGHAKEIEERSGLKVRVEVPAKRLPLTGEQRLALFRITQEALTNVVRHSRADTANVKLRFDGKELTLEIRDEGVGFEMGGRSLGLLGMEERAALIGASFSVTSAPGTGTTVLVTLPLQTA